MYKLLLPHHHHSSSGVHILVAVHEPDAGVVTDEPDDGVAVGRHSDRALNDWIDTIPRRRPVDNVIRLAPMMLVYI